MGGHEGVEAAAGAILHDETEDAFAGTDIQDGHDVRMAERGSAVDFARKFLDAGLVRGGAGAKGSGGLLRCADAPEVRVRADENLAVADGV